MPLLTFWCVLALALVAAPSAASAQATNGKATPSSPAIIPLASPGSDRRIGGYIDLTVEAYTPSPKGSVEAVVVLRAGDRTREIGRFGIFGRKAFDVASGAVAQRFSFTVPADVILRSDSRLTVKLIAGAGSIEGAEMRVGDAHHRF